MKAIVYERYGSPEVLRLADVETPTPTGDQVRVKVHAVSVNAPDWRLMRADPFLARASSGWLAPKLRTLGSDIAGTVDAVGPEVKAFRIGDAVFGDLFGVGFGGFAEYVCATEKVLVRKPEGVSFVDAAATPMAGQTALQALRDHAALRAGERLLIAGSSGGVGTFLVQLARLLGAEVTAVCGTAKVAQARELGAARVLDYSKEDFLQSGERYDVILGVNGYRSIWDYRRALAPGGRYLMVGGDWPQLRQGLLWGPVLSLFGARRFGVSSMKTSKPDLEYLARLLDAGTVRPVIDRHFPLSAVPDAIRSVEGGHARGKVLIDVAAY